MDQSRLEFVNSMHLKNPTDSYLAFAAGVEHQKAGNQEEAISIFTTLIENDPDYTDAYFPLGKIYETSNKIKKAFSVYHAGKKVATKKQDEKSLGEITEALMFMDEEEGNW